MSSSEVRARRHRGTNGDLEQRQRPMPESSSHKARRFHPVQLYLLIPFAALLWVPFYNFSHPELFGIPFFYWYQMAWTFVSAAIMVAVYMYEQRRRR